jgi:aryl-alcohol dehydrogenase-like predicted oxidoreductase
MLWRVIEAEVVPLCEKEGIGQMVFSPVGQGVLTGKYVPGGELPAGSRAADDRTADWIARYMRDDVLTRVQALKPIAQRAGLAMAQLAVAWVLQNPNAACAIIGATRPEQVHDNVGAVGVRLEPELMAEIDDVLGSVVERDPARTISPAQRP